MNVNDIFELIGALIILFGSIISVISAIGMIRFYDVYTRAHAATKTTTVAVLISLFGAFFFVWLGKEGYFSVRLVLVIVFVFLTAPVSGHLVLRAAYRAKTKMADETTDDELYPVLFGDEKDNRLHDGN